jgi:polysaccharide export outer membrane protein
MRKRWGWHAGILPIVLSLAIPVRAKNKGVLKTAKEVATQADGSLRTPSVSPVDSSYLIAPDDVLAIDVWKEAEITRTVPVRPDGKISLPLLNDVQAAGITTTRLASVITEKLKKFIANPQVTVIVTAVNSQKIYIIGEILKAGVVALLPNMTVLQAISSAGGFTQYANQKGVYVLRIEYGKQVKYRFNYKEVIKGINIQQNIALKPGDTIVVP